MQPTKKLRLPIGQDIFQSIIDNNLDFIDKSLFIKDVIDDGASVMLITRPRRFGKTLNLSMLHHFLSAEAFGCKTADLFAGLNITSVDDGKYMQHQGKYPVIFITLKDIKDHNFQHAFANYRSLIRNLVAQHRYLFESPRVGDDEKRLLQSFLDYSANDEQLSSALLFLSMCLHNHFNSKVWLLIDEYDTPLQNAYTNGYFNDMVNFMRMMFGSALKTNPYLHKGVITGILRISKESLFSELNNLIVYSTLDEKFSQYFGFTQEEVDYILQGCGLEKLSADIKHWYNGYQFGSTTIYNPWSIINCVNFGGILEPYWINTSGNYLIRQIIEQSQPAIKESFENLLQNKPVNIILDKHVTFGDLSKNEDAIFSLLLASGYLKPVALQLTPQGYYNCDLAFPNFEVATLFCFQIKQWLSEANNPRWFEKFMAKLLSGKIAEFAEDLKEIMLHIVSYNDPAKKPENFYHGFMLGILASLYQEKYEVKSNKESGLGRYDIVIMPKDTSQKAIIIELKSIANVKHLAEESQKALSQIDTYQYVSEVIQRGFAKEQIVKIGIAFCGKEFVVAG